jgi:hypothetical protein
MPYPDFFDISGLNPEGGNDNSRRDGGGRGGKKGRHVWLMEIVSLQNLSQQTNIQHSLLSEDTSCGEEQEGKTPQQHHDAHEKRTSRKRNALPGVICFQSGISHFFF